MAPSSRDEATEQAPTPGSGDPESDGAGGSSEGRDTDPMASIERIDEKIDALNDTIEDVYTKLEKIEQQQQLRPRIERVLPPHKPRSKEWRIAKGNLPEDSNIAWAGTSESVANAVEEPLEMVEETIQEMMQEGSVSTGEIDGDRRYWSSKHTAASGDRSISL